MGPERHRRLVVVVVLTVLFFLSSWMEDDYYGEGHQPSLRSTVKGTGKRAGKSPGGLEKDDKRRKMDHGGSEDDEEDGERIGGYRNLFDEDEDEDEPSYAKTLKARSKLYIRTQTYQFDLYSCLPRFICEVHAQPPGADFTELEKDIISLFKNYGVLEGPGSPIYTYQVAAHMGQLATGLDPSPCHSLYPSCPLSRNLLIDVLRNVKTSRRMFY